MKSVFVFVKGTTTTVHRIWWIWVGSEWICGPFYLHKERTRTHSRRHRTNTNAKRYADTSFERGWRKENKSVNNAVTKQCRTAAVFNLFRRPIPFFMDRDTFATATSKCKGARLLKSTRSVFTCRIHIHQTVSEAYRLIFKSTK